ncbi:MarR family transcriptional regulator [Anaerolineae bacterium CFX9]|jgi:DNA-binding MarR family transcriptional regulator|nr:MarR family transcriptional regulator [Anaerolineae bacterium CFX9]
MKLTGTAAIAAEIRLIAGLILKLNHRAIEARLSESVHEVTPVQFLLLHALSTRSYTMRDLSKRFMVDPSTLVPIISALERKGLIQRERDPSDRRRYPLQLTEHAVALMHELGALINDDVLTRSLTQLGDQKAQQLLSLLNELIRAMPEGETALNEARQYFDVHHEGCHDRTSQGAVSASMEEQPQTEGE